jgi:Phospholipase C
MLRTIRTHPTTAGRTSTATPIKHVIVIIGENRTFDNVYGTYVPKDGQRIANLLSRGIVNPDGTPGWNARARSSPASHRSIR